MAVAVVGRGEFGRLTVDEITAFVLHDDGFVDLAGGVVGRVFVKKVVVGVFPHLEIPCDCDVSRLAGQGTNP